MSTETINTILEMMEKEKITFSKLAQAKGIVMGNYYSKDHISSRLDKEYPQEIIDEAWDQLVDFDFDEEDFADTVAELFKEKVEEQNNIKKQNELKNTLDETSQGKMKVQNEVEICGCCIGNLRFVKCAEDDEVFKCQKSYRECVGNELFDEDIHQKVKQYEPLDNDRIEHDKKIQDCGQMSTIQYTIQDDDDNYLTGMIQVKQNTSSPFALELCNIDYENEEEEEEEEED